MGQLVLIVMSWLGKYDLNLRATWTKARRLSSFFGISVRHHEELDQYNTLAFAWLSPRPRSPPSMTPRGRLVEDTWGDSLVNIGGTLVTF